jgi:acylpyruvate hydrolase
VRFVTFEIEGRERIGVVVDEKVIDLTAAYTSYLAVEKKLADAEEEANKALPPSMLNFLWRGDGGVAAAETAVKYVSGRKFDVLGAVFPLKRVRLKAPIPRPGKMVCIGLNYEDYRKMLGIERSDYPMFFFKPSSTVIGPEEPIVIPRGKFPCTYSDCLWLEWEFTAVIGKKAKKVPKEKALDHVFGFTIFDDITAHDIEMMGPGKTFYQQRCKPFDTFSPMGPWIVKKDQMPDIRNLRMVRKRNGKIEWESSTKYMIHGVPEIIEFLSEVMTLEPGDIIPTASPPAGPKEGLQSGDVIEAYIEGIGTLRNPVVLEK